MQQFHDGAASDLVECDAITEHGAAAAMEHEEVTRIVVMEEEGEELQCKVKVIMITSPKVFAKATKVKAIVILLGSV